MGPPYQVRHTPPEFQVGKTQSIFGTAEINLFFPEPPGRAHSFGTLKPKTDPIPEVCGGRP